MIDTKARILDAAERLLSEDGFAACSLRAVTAAAGANLGAVNYHFRTKEALIQAVLHRRLEPINGERLAALDARETAAAGRPVPLPDLLHAFLDPLLRPESDGKGFMRLIGRMYSEPSLGYRRLFHQEIDPAVQRFAAAFRRTLPHLEPEDLFWRMFFTIGAMAHTLAAGPVLGLISSGACDTTDMEEAIERLIHYTGAALRAPGYTRRLYVAEKKRAASGPRKVQTRGGRARPSSSH
jgi:AcrR family transcriptional regulator